MVLKEAIRLTRSASRRCTVLTYALIYSEVLDIALNAERGKTFHVFFHVPKGPDERASDSSKRKYSFHRTLLF